MPWEVQFQIICDGRRPFCAGGVMVNYCVITAAPILRWSLGRDWARVEDYCADKGWVLEMHRPRERMEKIPTKPDVLEKVEWRNVGFSGTRDGMTAKQKATLKQLLDKLHEGQTTIWFRHGDCQGSDEQAHGIASRAGYNILIHPPDEERLRAHCEGAFSVLEPKPYRERNLRIVEKSHILLACPKGLADEEPRSGTWATIRTANNLGVPVRVIMSDGSFTKGVRKEK